jgi:hypothetical protein
MGDECGRNSTRLDECRWLNMISQPGVKSKFKARVAVALAAA